MNLHQSFFNVSKRRFENNTRSVIEMKQDQVILKLSEFIGKLLSVCMYHIILTTCSLYLLHLFQKVYSDSACAELCLFAF